jgi:hypothetical protein
MTHDDPTWLAPMLKKRTPDAIRVLMDLIEAGLRKGECSPNDVRERDLEQSNVIGGIFKGLPKFGFKQSDRRIRGKYKSQHGRKVFIWVLEDPTLARHLMNHMRVAVLGEAQPTTGQMVML